MCCRGCPRLRLQAPGFDRATPCPLTSTVTHPPTHPLPAHRPFITSWLAAKASAPGADAAVIDTVSKLVDKYMEAALEHKRLHCRWLGVVVGSSWEVAFVSWHLLLRVRVLHVVCVWGGGEVGGAALSITYDCLDASSAA